MTILQVYKEKLATHWTKERKSELKKQMRALKASGQNFEHLANCPTSYDIYKRVLYASK